MQIFPAFAIAAVFAAGASAQLPDSNLDPTIRVTSKLVQVNVVVHDKRNIPIKDLKKEEFKVLDNGKPQQIAVFFQETVATPRHQAGPENSFTNQFAEELGARSGYTVILLDWLNTEWSDQVSARDQVIRMLKSISPDDKVALCVLSSQLRVVHNFDSPPSELLAKLGRLRGSAGGPAGDDGSSFAYDAAISKPLRDLFPPSANSTGRAIGGNVEGQILAFNRRVTDTVQALSEIAAYLAGVPGRKSLIWVTAGFPQSADAVIRGAALGERTYTDEINRAIQKLNRADVAIYPVDARGLALGNPYRTIPTMEEFASRTGGKGFYNRNDLAVGMRAALNDQIFSYTLGYYAAATESRPGPHRVEVRVSRPGAIARYRRSYIDDDLNPPGIAQTNLAVRQALASPIESTSIGIRASVARRQETLEAHITVDATKIDLVERSNRWEGAVEIIARFTSDDGTQAGEISSSEFDLSLRRETYLAAREGGLALTRSWQIPKQASNLRILVLDRRAQQIGTLSIPLRQVIER